MEKEKQAAEEVKKPAAKKPTTEKPDAKAQPPRKKTLFEKIQCVRVVTGEALNVIEQLEAEKDALMGELDMRQDAQATGKAVIKEIDEWLAKTGEEEARQAGAMPNDYGCKHLDDPNWKKWWCGDCGDYCKRCGCRGPKGIF